MLPGPADASTAPKPKYMIGTTPTRPRQSRIALCATMSSVPLTCACANSSVTPDNVRNRSIGKPANTSRQPQAADEDADDPREREREQPDVEPRHARDHDRERQRAERDSAEAHRAKLMGSRERYCAALASTRRRCGSSEIRITPMIASPKFSLMIGVLPKK